jgi:protein phosphatase
MEFIISHKSIPTAKRREIENQDCYSVFQRSSISSLNKSLETIIAISDGMGGLNDPTEASQIAINSSLNYLLSKEVIDNLSLANSIVKANNDMLEKANKRDLGATLTILHIDNNAIQFSHIGDCRMILFSNGKTEILTTDHTKVAKKLGIKNPSIETIKDNSLSKKLSKSLGEKPFEVDYIEYSKFPIDLQSQDIIILCSDGVWTELNEKDLIDFVNQNPFDAADRITKAALEKDNSDDVTAITIKVI